MCGLVGIAGNTDKTWSQVFRNLLIFDTVRGFDSTGVGRVNFTQPKMWVNKELGSPTEDFFYKSVWCDLKGVAHVPWKVMMGHNRAATLGKVTAENAHPFTFGHITGAHNGTLHKYDDLHMAHKHEVDSMSLIHNIAEFGIEHTWANFHGAAAISWWDEEKETINFIRNDKRPLHFALAKKGTLLVWASEAWMITAACAQAGAKLDLKEDDEVDMWEMDEHYLHCYKPTINDIKLVEAPKELKPKPLPKYTNVVGFTKGGTPKTGTAPTHKNSTYNRYNNGKGFNWRWGKPLERAEKGAMEGREFRLLRAHDYYSTVSQSTVHIVQGAFIDGDKEMIQIYPETYEEWADYREAIAKGKLKDTVYRLKRRPRFRKSAFGDNAKPILYAAGSKSMEIASGQPEVDSEEGWINRDNELTNDRDEAQKDLEYTGCTCGFCDKTLTIDDKYAFLLYGQSVLCEDCAEHEPYISDLFGLNTNNAVIQ